MLDCSTPDGPKAGLTEVKTYITEYFTDPLGVGVEHEGLDWFEFHGLMKEIEISGSCILVDLGYGCRVEVWRILFPSFSHVG